jgi:hypothetical protein
MGYFVTSETSDYFIGYCECDQVSMGLPCLSCVAANEKYDRAEKLRMALLAAYYKHHRSWPQALFIDDLIAAFTTHALETT